MGALRNCTEARNEVRVCTVTFCFPIFTVGCWRTFSIVKFPEAKSQLGIEKKGFLSFVPMCCGLNVCVPFKFVCDGICRGVLWEVTSFK